MNALESLYIKALKAAVKRKRSVSGGAPIPAAERESFKKRAMRAAKSKYPKRIEIWGKRWFQKTYGSTYFTAAIYVNDKLVHKTSPEYGYGDHYIDAAWSWLEKQKIVPPRRRHSNGGKTPASIVARELGIRLLAHATDVARERDL